ncbi:MAG: hypothetical protein HYY34_03405 [Chloroflexi bacterium]|nr:hypothetical protein [Chloroflexota bacterium]
MAADMAVVMTSPATNHQIVKDVGWLVVPTGIVDADGAEGPGAVGAAGDCPVGADVVAPEVTDVVGAGGGASILAPTSRRHPASSSSSETPYAAVTAAVGSRPSRRALTSDRIRSSP